ncbi:unnamed protein product, partial [Didymodactylos carnosus]
MSFLNGNNNNSSINLNLNKSPLATSNVGLVAPPYILVKPFRISSSVLNLRSDYLYSTSSQQQQYDTNIAQAYSRLNEICGNNILSSKIKTITGYHLYEKGLIKKFLTANEETKAKEVLQQMWRASQFCDLLLIVQGSEYLAHRLLLAAYSNKFKQIFNKRKSDFVTRVHLRHSTHKAL